MVVWLISDEPRLAPPAHPFGARRPPLRLRHKRAAVRTAAKGVFSTNRRRMKERYGAMPVPVATWVRIKGEW